MLFNLQHVIARLATPGGAPSGSYTFTAGPTYTLVDGVMVPGPPGPAFTAPASVQPLRSKTVQQLPEGARAEDWREIWVATTERITPAEAQQEGGGGGRGGHTVEVDGVEYMVEEARDWRSNGGFWWCLVQKVAR